jgi:hypothetical protein
VLFDGRTKRGRIGVFETHLASTLSPHSATLHIRPAGDSHASPRGDVGAERYLNLHSAPQGVNFTSASGGNPHSAVGGIEHCHREA